MHVLKIEANIHQLNIC